MPMALRPGIGAKILTSAVANASAISSASETTRLTLTPAASSISYRVTVGPLDQPRHMSVDLEIAQRLFEDLAILLSVFCSDQPL